MANLEKSLFLSILLSFTFQGASCQLVLSSSGSSLVKALAGSNVTLSVSFSGASDPVLTWSRGTVTVATWTVNSSSPPDIAVSSKNVLRIENNGSLTFVNVPLSFTDSYTLELTKSGLAKVSKTFILNVFENIQNVTLSTQPASAKEGVESLILQYDMLQGVVEQQTWQINGREIKNSSHYSIVGQSLMILGPNRSDTGLYSVFLMNPFSSATARINVTVLYGPDEPVVAVHPAQPFYKAGDSLSLSCQAAGFPQPISEWMFGGQVLPGSRQGVLNLTNVLSSQGGVYTCSLINGLTAEKREKNVTLTIYERPPGTPMCSVLSTDNIDLQYHCSWIGGTPQAQLSIPALSNSSSGAGSFSLTVNASADLNKKTVVCMVDHPLEQNKCNITTNGPMRFLPFMGTSIDPDGKIVVAISCVSAASPLAAVSWSKGSEVVVNGTTHQISSDTAQLRIRSYNISSFLVVPNYTCTCRNPLGSQSGQILLQGPSISHSSLFSNPNGTIITLTWEVPATSIVTGFDVQMKGPALLSKKGRSLNARSSSDGYSTIQQKPGSARSADIFTLDPNLTYRFRIVPKARLTDGLPSQIHTIGPGGLSGPAIAGIAAGIPCSILFLVLVCGLIYLIIYCNKNKNHQTRYPVSRAVEKTKSPQPKPNHSRLTGGLKSPPDYNRLQKTPSERSVALPTFVPPPPVRVATTV